MAPCTSDKVSVIIPIYNAAKFLDQCLTSIETQTHKELEIICINDGSTDNSLEIIKAHAAKDERYVVVDKENAGYGAGCNKGIETATGEWISIIEPDDWIDEGMYADMLAHAVEVAGKDTTGRTIDIIKTPWKDICEWDKPEKSYIRLCPLEGKVKSTDCIFTLAEEPFFIAIHPAIWSAIYRTDFILEKGIKFREYPGAGWADNPFLIETLAQASGIVYWDKSYYNYRCDLPYSTMNHATEEAVARPFDRWLEMTDVLDELGVKDRNILEAHYLRGFNYAFGAVYDDGIKNPIVDEKIKEVFGRMDPDVVFSIEILPARRRKYFCEVRGIPEPKISPLPRIKYLVGQAGALMKMGGPKLFAERLKYSFFTEKQKINEKDK